MLEECIFQAGDKVSCNLGDRLELGEVVDTFRIRDFWVVMVDHGSIESIYTPNELSLVAREENTVVYVNFKTKRKMKI